MSNNTGPSRIELLGTDSNTSTITGVTAGTSQAIARQGYGVLSFFFRSIGTTSGGTLIIEEADWSPRETIYSGTWSQIASISASTFTGGAQFAYHLSNNAFGYVRVRISSAITGGGSVYVTLRSQSA